MRYLVKKILYCILALAMLVCCLSVVGCKDDKSRDQEEGFKDFYKQRFQGIDFTAERPIIDLSVTWREREWEYKLVEKYTYWGYEPITYIYSFNDTANYYLENLTGNKIYLLNSANMATNKHTSIDRWFAFYQHQELPEVLLVENFSVYDEDIVEYSDRGISVALNIFIKPTERIEKDELKFEYGIIKQLSGLVKLYINVYAGEESFATCYFDYCVTTITEEWFENYFKTNLIYGDDLLN